MIYGQFQRHFPRVTLDLPGATGMVSVEFVVDTGFEGELAAPSSILRDLDVQLVGLETVALADGTLVERPVYELSLVWDDEPRPVQILGLEGNPLLGMLLLEGCQIRIEAVPDGDVVIEPV